METQNLQVIPAEEHKDQSVESLIRCAIERNSSVETLERLMAIRRELKAEAAKEAFERSMAAFQADCPTIAKTKQVMNKTGNSVRYCYAPLEVIIEQVKALLQKHGFNYTLDAKVEGTWVEAICQSTHSMGHSKTSSFKVPIDKDAYMAEAQKFASALTFCKRYAFCNAFGILTGDDDDDAISTHAAEKPPAKRPPEQSRGQRFDNSPPPPQQMPKPEVAEAWKQNFLKQVKEKGAEVYAYGVAMQLGWVIPGVDKLSDASPEKFPQNNDEKLKVWEKIKALKEDAIKHGGVTQELQEAYDKAYAELPPPKPASTKEPAAPPNVARSVPAPVSVPRSAPGSSLPDEWFLKFVVPIPYKGQKRDEYLKNPDTIGGLYEAAKGGDTKARTRLFGFAEHFEPKGWEKRDGTPMPPSETDKKFREALDAFMEWREGKEQTDENRPRDVPHHDDMPPGDDDVPF